jgi:hypothetical protein
MKFTATVYMASSLMLGCLVPEQEDGDELGEESFDVEVSAEPGARIPNNQPFANAAGE